MNSRNPFLIVVLALAIASITSACDRQQQGTTPQVQKTSDNVSTPGTKGGSCSATSDDKKHTCSITCTAGHAAYCDNTQTTATCVCQG
jgi:hypothetical protein